MADSFQLQVATPERLLVEHTVSEATIPALEGEIGVLPDHAPLLSLLGTGELKFSGGGASDNVLFVSGGWVQVLDNHVRVLADRAEKKTDIDVSRAEESLRRANERLAAPASAGVDVARALNAKQRAEARLALAKGH